MAGRRRSTRSIPSRCSTSINGKDPAAFFNVEPTQFNNNGNVLASPWKFKQHGESGIPVSDLFPHVATCVDELAVIRSMVSEFPEHTFANYFLHTGSGLQGRPSMGAWVNYGLGSECQNLPGFVVINGGLIPPGGLDCFGSGFLPASYQGSVFKPTGSGVANITRTEPTPRRQRDKLDLISQLDELALAAIRPARQPRIGDPQLRTGLLRCRWRSRSDVARTTNRRTSSSCTAWSRSTNRRGSTRPNA